MGFILVPSWPLLGLSLHPHAVLSLALAGGSLLPRPQSWLSPPAQLSPLSGDEICGALFGHRSCLAPWAEEGVQGADPAAHSPPAARTGRGGEGGGRGRGRVKAGCSPPPEGVTAL